MLAPLPFGGVELAETEPGRCDRTLCIDADDPHREPATERDRPTQITPVSEEVVTPESAHELEPRTRDALSTPPLFGGLIRGGVSRQQQHGRVERGVLASWARKLVGT